MKASICLVPFTDQKRFLQILSQVRKAKGLAHEIIIVDNSPTMDIKRHLREGEIYISNKNVGKLAGACNKAIKIAKGKYFVYLCAVHTRIYADDWLLYMVRQMEEVGDMYVLGGDLRPFGSMKHVQGGVFIGRTAWMRQNPYDEKKHPFTFMDVYLSKKILGSRLKMLRLGKIYSSMLGWSAKNHAQNKTLKKFKIVHSHETYNYK
jgi:GT2 family glycosyltransferase